MTALQALDRYYDRLETRGDVVSRGWSVEPIGLVLELDADGSLLSGAVVDRARQAPLRAGAEMVLALG